MTAPEPAADQAATTPPALPGDAERRLHPGSWLFTLLQNLKQAIAPILVLVFAGGRDEFGLPWWIPLLGIAALVAVSIWQYLTFRYRIEDDRLVVRSGLLERNVRQIPYSRIHNVEIQQGLLHRLLGVAEVRLESAGGTRPEAEMRVLRMDQALALEQLIRDRNSDTPTQAAVPSGGTSADDGVTLLSLSTLELIKYGLISNRGMIVIASATALALQILPERLIGHWVIASGRHALGHASGYSNALLSAGMVTVVSVAALIALALLLIRLFSILLALLRYHGFRLRLQGRRLTVERGLLARSRSSLPRRRIQAWTLKEGLLHRLLGRRTLEVDTASADDTEGQGKARAQRGLDALAPIATPATCDAIVHTVANLPAWPPTQWQPLHRHAWLRLMIGDIPLVFLACAVLGWNFGVPWGALGLLWLPWSAFMARHAAVHAGYAIDNDSVAIREGWWKRTWRLAEIEKLQAVELRRSPLDRYSGMASVWLDTAGANPLGTPLRLRFLPLHEAERIHVELARQIRRRPMHW